MYLSKLIDLIVYILLLEFGFAKLLQWFYDGPHAREIFMAFTALLFIGVLWLVVGGRNRTE